MTTIVPNDNCLTQDQILRYLQDETSPSENKAIDRHLTHCPMCSDAIEGAMQLPTEQLTQTFSSIETKISDNIAAKTVKTLEISPLTIVHRNTKPYWITAAAASVALLAVASIWFFNQKNETTSAVADAKMSETALETEKSVAATPPQSRLHRDVPYSALDTIKSVASTTDKSIVLKNKPSEKPTFTLPPQTNQGIASANEMPQATVAQPVADAEQTGKIAIFKDKTADIASNAPAAPTVAEVAKAEAMEKQKEVIADVQERALSNKPTFKKVDSSNDSKMVGTAANQAQEPQYPGAAMQNVAIPEVKRSGAEYDKATYAKQEKAKSAAKPMPVDAQTQLVKAITYFENKQYDLAIGDLNRLLGQEKSGIVYEKTLWYLANAYWQKGDKKTAKRLFERIVKENSPFTKEAEAFLKN